MTPLKKKSELRQKASLLKWLFYPFELSEITSVTQNHVLSSYWFIINHSKILKPISNTENILLNWHFAKLFHPLILLLHLNISQDWISQRLCMNHSICIKWLLHGHMIKMKHFIALHVFMALKKLRVYKVSKTAYQNQLKKKIRILIW